MILNGIPDYNLQDHESAQVLSSNFKVDGIASVAFCGCITDPPSFRQNQDGALLNSKTGLFAIADGADRYPGSALKVLNTFNTKITELIERFSQDSLWQLSRDHLPFVKKAFIQTSNTAAEQLQESVGSTFTGLQILNTPDEKYGILMHTGDSSLWEYNKLTNQIRKLTKNNFWMIGKTKELYQTEMLRIKNSSVFLFVTDGITILDLIERSNQGHLWIKEILNQPLLKIPEKLIEAQSAYGGIVDDASCLALFPKNCSI